MAVDGGRLSRKHLLCPIMRHKVSIHPSVVGGHVWSLLDCRCRCSRHAGHARFAGDRSGRDRRLRAGPHRALDATRAASVCGYESLPALGDARVRPSASSGPAGRSSSGISAEAGRLSRTVARGVGAIVFLVRSRTLDADLCAWRSRRVTHGVFSDASAMRKIFV